MIGGLYNTTSLLIEPTRALGEFLRTTEGSSMPVSSQRSIDGVMNSVKGLDAVPEPERLPTGITTFIPVVVKMRETKAAEAAEADRAKEAIETVAAPAADEGRAPGRRRYRRRGGDRGRCGTRSGCSGSRDRRDDRRLHDVFRFGRARKLTLDTFI